MNLKAGDKITLSYSARGEKRDGKFRKFTKKLKVLKVYEHFILAWNGKYRVCINMYDIDTKVVHIEKV